MEFEDEELVNEFVVESIEHLADIETALAIEEGAGENNTELVNKVFRGIHSIKGAAGFLGLETIKVLAHSLENVLNKIRSNELQSDSAITDVMLRAGDTLRNLLNDAANSNGVDVSDQIAALNQVMAGESPTSTLAPAENTPALPNNLPEISSPEPDSTSHLADVAQEVAIPSPAETITPAQIVGVDQPDNFSQEPIVSSVESSPQDNAPARSGIAESSIRVPVGVLDQLMNLAGELVLNRNRLLQAVASQEQIGLEAAASELDQVTSNLQEAIMQTRMQPIGNVFGKFPRIVRDLSSKLGKECKLEIEGKEVDVDKTIIEAIGDPLTHLIRNSVDHGVEMPAVRVKQGKERSGTVWLRAFHKAGKVCLEIQDNGAGIHPDKLKQKAVEKGIISADRAAQMSDREAVRLIFHPGFSMAEKLSDVSGRGVGMDVVRTNIEKLGGCVDVESVVGEGTNIRVTLPLTLAIIPSMIIKCGGERFAIPQANVAELVRLRPAEVDVRIGRVKTAEVLRLRGTLLPLVRLDESLSLPRKEKSSRPTPVNIIVVETGQVRYGLIVDGIHDSEEIVVKPLGRHLKSSNCLAGATILGDGRIALILDAAGIATRTGVQLAHETVEREKSEEQESLPSAEVHTLLLFSSAPSDQFAVPMGVVTRIERVRSDQIKTVAGCALLQYRGTSLPLLAVEDHLNAKPRPECDWLYVIVFTIADREVGLIAPQLDDIRDITQTVDSETFRVPGVAGSLVIDDRTTRLLDVFELAQAAHPQWFTAAAEEKETAQEAQPSRILLAEDSSFFRRQVAGFLKSEGFLTFEYEDGEAAWNALTDESVEVDLIVTDIEMPNLNGFELCAKIKDDPRLSQLPVIALTSLSSPKDVEQGKRVGFDDYQVKMHRDNLVRAVRQLLKKTPVSTARNKQPCSIGS